MDVTKEEEVRKVFAEIAKKYGKLDILCNNAGIIYKNPEGRLQECDPPPAPCPRFLSDERQLLSKLNKRYMSQKAQGNGLGIANALYEAGASVVATDIRFAEPESEQSMSQK